MISIQPSAKKVFASLILPAKAIGVRIRVQTAGCNGLAYVMEWCYSKNKDDHILEAPKRIYIDSKSAIYLHGSELNYFTTKFEEGFEFSNPNETAKCGCGESFYVA
jgi:iron-sulfur cluster assembly protein